jgi:hypothetical protein
MLKGNDGLNIYPCKRIGNLSRGWWPFGLSLSASVSGRLGAERRALLRRARNSLISASLPCTTARSASTFRSTCATNLDNNNSTLPLFNDSWNCCNHIKFHTWLIQVFHAYITGGYKEMSSFFAGQLRPRI